jgi:hypothetical protein
MLQQLNASTVEGLRAILKAELVEEAREEALTLARAELEDEFQRRVERLQDQMSRRKSQLEDELEDQLEAREQALRRELREAYEERVLTVQDDLQACLRTRDRLQALLLSVMTQVVPEKPKYLHDVGLRELDVVGLNALLAPMGMRIRGEYRHSERQVLCQLPNGARQLTVFWRESTVPGVVDADEMDSHVA